MLTKNTTEAGGDVNFVVLLFLFCPRCKQVCISRPHNQHNCCLSESWTDLRSDSFRKGMCLAWRELRTNKLCQHSVCSLKSLSLPASLLLSQHCHLAHLLSPPSLISSVSLPRSLFSLHLHPLSSTKPPYCRHFHPHYSLPQPEPRQAGRLPGWGPRWCSGESASSGSLSLQDGRTALLWPIWPRPVLAPVCDYGPAGGRQGWHSGRTVPVHSRLGTDCGRTH